MSTSARWRAGLALLGAAGLVGAGVLWARGFGVRLDGGEEATARLRRPRYAEIPKIDVHVHLPPDRAADAIRVLRAHGIEMALNASGGHPGDRLDASAAASRGVGGRLPPYCHLDWSAAESPGFAAYVRVALRECRDAGAVGLKIFKALGLGYRLSDGSLLRADDPRLDPAFEEAGRLRLPVLIHTGDPQAFFRPPTPENERYDELSAHPGWSFYGPRPDGGEWPSWEELFAQFEARVARHPETRFLGAHFGNAPEEPERVGRMLARYPNLYVDTAARVPEIGRYPETREVFLRHPDRILFGTDFQMGSGGEYVLGSAGERPDPASRVGPFFDAHWRYFETADRAFAHPTPIQGRWTIDGIALPRDVLEQLYHRNAEQLFGVRLPSTTPPPGG
ncbi:MAG: amidohydrolase family protein [Sandaracinaceae bacterium]